MQLFNLFIIGLGLVAMFECGHIITLTATRVPPSIVKRQFYGNQYAQNMQNNQFAAPSGMMMRRKRQFYGTQNANNIQNNQFAAGVSGGMSNSMGDGFGGPQTMQNNYGQ